MTDATTSPPECEAPQLSLGHSLIKGACSLGTALALERGGSFLGNMLAARLAGPTTFGAFSVAVTTATSVAAYAGAGIGNTATRFVSEAPNGRSRARILRTLLLFGLVSSMIAVVGLWIAARPFATQFLHNSKLTWPLQIGALSAAAFVAVELCRGIFVGMRSFARLLLLSGTLAVGLLVAVPGVARFGPAPMVGAQFAATFVAVAVGLWMIVHCIFSTGKNQTGEITTHDVSLATVWKFGLVQLSGVVGLNAAGWWTALMVARNDSTLVQMALYTVAMQWKNLCALMPSMIQQGNYAFYTDRGASGFGGAARVTTMSYVLASVLSLACTVFLLLVIPFILSHFYSDAYTGGQLATGISLLGAVIQLGNASASSRLAMVSMRWTAAVNGIFSLFVIVAGTLLIPRGGAEGAVTALFLAHALSVLMVAVALKRAGELPAGVFALGLTNIVTSTLLAIVCWVRVTVPGQSLLTGVLLLVISAAGVRVLWEIGERCQALPDKINLFLTFRSLLARNPLRFAATTD